MGSTGLTCVTKRAQACIIAVSTSAIVSEYRTGNHLHRVGGSIRGCEAKVTRGVPRFSDRKLVSIFISASYLPPPGEELRGYPSPDYIRPTPEVCKAWPIMYRQGGQGRELEVTYESRH